MLPDRVVWPIFALLVGFFLGGSFVWGLQEAKPNPHRLPTQSEQPHAISSGATAQQEQASKGGQKGSWYDTFLNHTPDWFVALFTALLTFVTYRLVRTTGDLRGSTDKLWEAGERQIEFARESAVAQSRDMQASIAAAQQSADAAQTQATIMAAIEGPVPLVNQIKLVQYTQIPGEILISDPLLPGPIPSNCRILIAVENKGRTVLRIIELCVEKFVGADLPIIPDYSHSTTFNFYLEKGPIWLRGSDAQIAVGAADIGKMRAAYPSHGAFWVYGYFAYPDLLNRKIKHKFCARWDETVGFVPDNRPDYT